MDANKKKKLDAAGWKIGTTKDFLGLSASEQEYIELKLSLAKKVAEMRVSKKLTQAQLAERIKSSQSRVAKMEAGDASVSIDLLVRTLLELNVSKAAVSKTLTAPLAHSSKKSA